MRINEPSEAARARQRELNQARSYSEVRIRRIDNGFLMKTTAGWFAYPEVKGLLAAVEREVENLDTFKT